MKKLYTEDEKYALLERVIDLLNKKNASTDDEAKKRRPKMAKNEKLEGKEAPTVNGKGKESSGKDIAIVVLSALVFGSWVFVFGFWAFNKSPETKPVVKATAPAVKDVAPAKTATPVKKVAAAAVVEVAAPAVKKDGERHTIRVVNKTDRSMSVKTWNGKSWNEFSEKIISGAYGYVKVPLGVDFSKIKVTIDGFLGPIGSYEEERMYYFEDALTPRKETWVIN